MKPEKKTDSFKLEKIFGWLLKGLTLLSVLGITALSVSILFYSFYDIAELISIIGEDYTQKDKVIAGSLKAVDLLLLGFTIFLIGLGLFELFIKTIPNLPQWLEITDIDQLKAMLVKVAIVIMCISFTGTILTWDGQSDLLGYGLGLGAVVLSLSYFLQVKKH